MSLSIHEHGTSLHLFSTSLISLKKEIAYILLDSYLNVFSCADVKQYSKKLNTNYYFHCNLKSLFSEGIFLSFKSLAGKDCFWCLLFFECSSVSDLMALAPFRNYDVKADTFKGCIWEYWKSALLCTGGLVLRQNPCFLLSTGVIGSLEFFCFALHMRIQFIFFYFGKSKSTDINFLLNKNKAL